jgi:putative tricarboxylic transport membrane protein
MQHPAESAPGRDTAWRDIAAGLFLVVIAVAIVIAAFDLRIGTAARMGPGFLPLALGALLGIVGTAIAANGLRSGEPLPRWQHPRALLALVASFIAFALLIEPAGLVPSAFAAVAIASAAIPGRRVVETLCYAAALAAFAWALFVVVLEMPLKVWP